MIDPAAMQLIAVVIGGLLAVGGGFLSTTLLERRRQRQEASNLALAFGGEISTLLELIRERRYIERFEQIIGQIETTGQPFFMPFRIRYEYSRVYQANVGRIGLLQPTLAEQIPVFYTRPTSVLDDMASLGDGTYAQVDVSILLRVYRDSKTAVEAIIRDGERILETIRQTYKPA